MISRALRENTRVSIPSVVDPSPFWLESWFLAQKHLDPGTVRGFDLVLLNESKGPEKHLLRNLFINYAEGRLYQAAFFLNQGRRAALEAKRGPDEIQYWDEESEKVIAGWRREARDDVEKDGTLNALLVELPKTKNRSEREALRDVGVAELTKKVNEAKETLLLDPSADLRAIVEAKATIAPLRQKIRAYLKLDSLHQEMANLLTELDSLELSLGEGER